jgi:hypothetical protein
MLFPLAVLFAAVWLGRGPAVLAAFLSVALFDFFFVKPHFTLVIEDLQYLLTFVVLLAVALITTELVARLRRERDAAGARGEEAARSTGGGVRAAAQHLAGLTVARPALALTALAGWPSRCRSPDRRCRLPRPGWPNPSVAKRTYACTGATCSILHGCSAIP